MKARRSCSAIGMTLAASATVTGCAALHVGPTYGHARPSQIVGEWIDVAKTSPTDSSIWVLRPNGYDGSLRVRVVADSTGALHAQRKETHYGSWYFDGALGDAAHQALCFSKRVGRFGATCISFSMDTIQTAAGPLPRLLLRGYAGEHHTSDRVLVALHPDTMQPVQR